MASSLTTSLVALYFLLAFGEIQAHSNTAVPLRCGNGDQPEAKPVFSGGTNFNHKTTNQDNGLNPFSLRSKRFANNNHNQYIISEYYSQNRDSRYIEVLVAVDDTMHKYHGSDLNDYVLSLMFTASKVFADPSIGNSIHLSVKNIITLEDDLNVRTIRSGNKTGKDVYQFLDNFCQHMGHNKSHLSGDVALLLTR